MLTEQEKHQIHQTIDRMTAEERRDLMDHLRRSLTQSSDESPEHTKHFRQLCNRMDELREGTILGDDLTIRDLIEEGRRF